MSTIQPVNQPPSANLPPNPQQVRVQQTTGTSAPCPRCQHTAASTVGFTWWGGVVGPRIFHVVRCLQCGTQYNGKTGGTLGKSIAIYYGIALALVLVLTLIGTMAK